MRIVIITTLLTHFCVSVFAQLCDGNLGENIFIDGDFGTGVNNILPNDPQIAPGYRYTTVGPPPDGLYVLSNNTGAWPGLYGTWMMLGDNSADPNGYMMVVNASFEPGLFYEQVVDGLCENTSYVFQADVINVVKREVLDHIKPNVTFLLDDEVQFSSGDIPQDETWKTYGFVFETQPGQTSVKLSIRNNAPGGIGNDLAIDNISFQACGPEALILPFEVENICEDGNPINLNATVNGDQFPTPAFQWQESFNQGTTWQDIPGANQRTFIHDKLSGGFYYYRYLISNSSGNLTNPKCAIISNTKIVFVQPKEYMIIDSICAGNSLMVGNSQYSQTGVYVDSLISSIGCDSVVTLDLTIVPDQGISVDRTITDPTCFSFMDASIGVTNISNAYNPVNLTIRNLETDSLVGSMGLSSGNYQLSVEDRYGCQFTETIQIIDPAPFILELGQDTIIPLGQELGLSVSSNYTIVDFESSFSDSICQNNCLNVSWFPTETETYTVTAISELGCETQDSIKVTVNPIRSVYIPNAFTPNGDGVNDFFTVFGSKPLIKEVETLMIFDRWGQLVFNRSNFQPNIPEVGWQGQLKNNEINSGVYLYFAKVRFMDDVITNFSGDILLLEN